MELHFDLNKKVYNLTVKYFILIIIALILIGIIIGSLNSGFFGRYVLWFGILAIILLIKPLHILIKSRKKFTGTFED